MQSSTSFSSGCPFGSISYVVKICVGTKVYIVPKKLNTDKTFTKRKTARPGAKIPEMKDQ